MPTGGSEKRTPVELAVVLFRAHKKLFKERVVTENVSSHGLGVVTKSLWPPGTRILVSFAGENIGEQARVVYCQRLTKVTFAVGIHFSTKVSESDCEFCPAVTSRHLFVLKSTTPA